MTRSRLVVAALLSLFGALSLEAQVSHAEVEEASEVARRAAVAAIRGPQRIFLEALDTEGLLVSHLGSAAWNGLTARQRDLLRGAVKENFLLALSPPRPLAPEIAWSSAAPSAAGVDVFLGLRLAGKILRTRWVVKRAGEGWLVADVVLTDPGISLARAALRSLGPEPVLRRDRARAARAEALPRLALIAVLLLVVALAGPRLTREKRTLLFLTAAAPTILFAVDGALAVARVLSEPYLLRMPPPRAAWSRAEEMALEKQGGSPEKAGELWQRALDTGGPRAPLEYGMAIAARQRGDREAARAAFQRALAEKVPAPGAARELAAMALEDGSDAEALALSRRYRAAAGPDPDALALEAVALTNLGENARAVEAIHEARQSVGEGWRAAELEARIRARAGDAAGAVEALKPLEAEGKLDREALRSDPSYLPIATNPAWVKFLNDETSR